MITIPSRTRQLGLVTAACAVLAVPPESSAQEPGAGPRDTVLGVTQGPRGGEWKRAFNPFRDDTDTRWPATAGVYEPLLVYSRATRTYLPWLATAYQWGAGNLTLRLHHPSRRRVVRRTAVHRARRGVHLRSDATLSRPRPRRGVGLPGRRQERRRHERRVHLPARLHARASWPSAPSRSWPSTSGRTWPSPPAFDDPSPVATGPFVEVRRFSPTSTSSGATRSTGRRTSRRSRPCACRSSATTTRSCVRSRRATWTGRRSSSRTSRSAGSAKDPARHLYWYPDFGQTVLMHVNTRRKPFDDASVRKAVSLALDRPRIMREAMQRLRAPRRRHGARRVPEPVEGPPP